jgi:L-2-hydroxyglutarate oxidase LhgO
MFYAGASKFIKNLDRDSFIPDMSGIRPQRNGKGGKDFILKHEDSKGLEGFIDLIGIESPGLTATLSIAAYVKKLVKDIFN